MAGPKYGDFKHPRSFGFTGSADAAEGRVSVRPHTRGPRKKMAEGGKAETLSQRARRIVFGGSSGSTPKPDPNFKPGEGPLSRRKGVSEAALERRMREAGLAKGGRVKY